MKTAVQNLQIKLSFDEGLKNIWGYLTREYQGLDKTSIIRLALNNLAKITKNQQYRSPTDIVGVIETLKRTETGINEDEFFDWWNKSKKTL